MASTSTTLTQLVHFLTLKKGEKYKAPHVILNDFDPQRYRGRWYEIARVENFFERDLSNVTSYYDIDLNGKLHLTNQGYNEKKKKWQTKSFTAKQTNIPNLWDLYMGWIRIGEYRILDINFDYTQAIVCGSSLHYFWLLARSPIMTQEEHQRLWSLAHHYGLENKIVPTNHHHIPKK